MKGEWALNNTMIDKWLLDLKGLVTSQGPLIRTHRQWVDVTLLRT